MHHNSQLSQLPSNLALCSVRFRWTNCPRNVKVLVGHRRTASSPSVTWASFAESRKNSRNKAFQYRLSMNWSALCAQKTRQRKQPPKLQLAEKHRHPWHRISRSCRVSRCHKNLAMRLHMCLLFLSQCSRQCMKEITHPPILKLRDPQRDSVLTGHLHL